MPMLTLGQAAKLTGLGKTTITRAIKAGRLSAARRDDGSYEIDPAELSRVYNVTPETHETVTQSGHVVRHATPNATPRDGGGDAEVAMRLAALEAEVQGLKALLSEVKSSRDELRHDRDGWKVQAERLIHALPSPESTQMITGSMSKSQKRRWWHRLAG